MRLASLRLREDVRTAVWCDDCGAGAWIDCATASRVVLGEDMPTGMRDVLARSGPRLEPLRRIQSMLRGRDLPGGVMRWSDDEAVFAPPVPDPGAFLDFYAFEEHVRRARARRGLEIVPEWYEYPVYYRSNQRAMFGQDAEIHFPAGETKMDFELELGAVLGETIHSPTPDEAEAAIVGYCLLNDWSARAIQAETMKVGLGPNKGKDFATAIGPWITTTDEIGDVRELELAARVNGEEWSRGRIGAMHWRWGEMLAFAAEGVRFEPGDVFGSGTVGGGCGLELGRFLADGDVVELDGGDLLGVLRGTARGGAAEGETP
jgi:fumarylacetoacetate (FAA) hydrolase